MLSTLSLFLSLSFQLYFSFQSPSLMSFHYISLCDFLIIQGPSDMETLEKLDPEEAKQIDFETVHNIGKFILRMDQISDLLYKRSSSLMFTRQIYLLTFSRIINLQFWHFSLKWIIKKCGAWFKTLNFVRDKDPVFIFMWSGSML